MLNSKKEKGTGKREQGTVLKIPPLRENGDGPQGKREQGTVLKIPPTRENGDGPQKKLFLNLYFIKIKNFF